MSLANVVADIGGTNIRIGISTGSGIVTRIEKKKCAEYPSLQAVLAEYIEEKGLTEKRINMCLAIACPVENDLVVMTNLPWQFSKTELKQELNLRKLFVINDYTAIAFSVPLLNSKQKVQIGEGTSVPNKPISICGPGTGLGVAHIQPQFGHWHHIACEGGHTDFAPVDETEINILSFLLKKYEHVSYEQLLSGLGLEQIYQAIHPDNAQRSASEITASALAKDDEVAEETLAQFCRTLGSFAGNLALTVGSFGGVYIAGGIAPRFVEYIESSDFRQRFEAKGRLSSFNQNIPTYVITESQPGLIGASSYINQQISEGM
ncbi:glucokinase [Thalassotalea agarivorans]|uniref:Glucokinase n=1 Tax=Thalassotalea agarivorans TaxID=349064 RepID=A0A1I0EYC6_THASX|nr:glucokinase [Thalassotalea agarivorans]SET50533.1 glucokinase [Thalassotalea agarivorans]